MMYFYTQIGTKQKLIYVKYLIDPRNHAIYYLGPIPDGLSDYIKFLD